MDRLVRFIEYHVPVLKPDCYSLEIKHTATVHQQVQHDIVASKSFAVNGERLKLNDDSIKNQFPPSNKKDSYRNTLPHILLSRKTLPWERELGATSSGKNKKDPWLALILISENEAISTTQVKFSELNADKSVFFPQLNLDFGQSSDDICTVIDLPNSLFEMIVPCIDDLSWLCHVRQVESPNSDLSAEKTNMQEYAAVMANRFPTPSQKNFVYLISLEQWGSYLPGGKAINCDKARFIVLNNWFFEDIEQPITFKDAIKNLNSNPANLRMPLLSKTENSSDKYLNEVLEVGYIPLMHHTRLGGQTMSWYRGPLVPKIISENTASQNYSSADEFVSYNPKLGMYDISYASAWQLGRLLALSDTSFSAAYLDWKRQITKSALKNVQTNSSMNLSVMRALFNDSARLHNLYQQHVDEIEPPSIITEWLANLVLLEKIPLNYLLPDERLLPKESIRFFVLDANWIKILLQGACNIGPTHSSEKILNKTIVDSLIEQARSAAKTLRLKKLGIEISNSASDTKNITGVLLRSEILLFWPQLEIIASADLDNAQKLVAIRMERLAPDLMIVMFDGIPKRIELQLPAGMLHFGVDDLGKEKPIKPLRYIEADQHITPGSIIKNSETSLTWRHLEKNVLDIANSAKNINLSLKKLKGITDSTVFTSAEFALQMIEGVLRACFVIQTSDL